MIRLIPILAAILFITGPAVAGGWEEKLKGADFAFCMKQNSFDYDTALIIYDGKRAKRIKTNARVCKGQSFAENNIEGYLTTGNFYSWSGYGSMLCGNNFPMSGKKYYLPSCANLLPGVKTATIPSSKSEDDKQMGTPAGTVPDNLITCDFTNLKVDGDRAGNGKLHIALEKSGYSWVLLKVRGPENASSHVREFFKVFFRLPSRSRSHYDIQYEPEDIRMFPLGNHAITKRGALNFDVELDNGMFVELRASRKAKFSIEGGDGREFFDARGECFVPAVALASDALPAPVRANSPFKYDANGRVTGEEAFTYDATGRVNWVKQSVLMSSMSSKLDYEAVGGDYSGKGHFHGLDGTIYSVGIKEDFDGLSLGSKALVAMERGWTK